MAAMAQQISLFVRPFQRVNQSVDRDVLNTFRIMNTDVKIIANFVKTRQGNGLTFEDVLYCSARFSFIVKLVRASRGKCRKR